MTSFIRLQDVYVVADQLHELIAVHNLAGRYVYVNPAFERATGYRLDDLREISPIQLIHKDSIHALLDAFQKLSQHGGQERPIKHQLITKSGEYIWMDTTLSTLEDERGKMSLIVSASQTASDDLSREAFEQARKLVAMEERQRLARDLHDAVSQTLFSASVIAETLPMLYDSEPDEVIKGLNKLASLTKGALAEMRTLLVELRPTALFEIDLSQLLTYLVNSFRTRLEGEIVYENIGCGKLMDSEVKVSFYRIAQEALNNIVRHSRATSVMVQLLCTDDAMTLDIQDNGRGFDAKLISGSHMGLRIMFERAESCGIELDIISIPNEGTQVRLMKSTESVSNE